MSNSNEPAYPTSQGDHYQGLTKREVFAMAAMQGLCANPRYITQDWKQIIVKEAGLVADLQLKELEK